MSVLLIGATGRTGLPLAARLHNQGTALRVVIRHPDQQRAFAELGAQTLVADLRDDFSRAFDGVHTVIYAAGSAETEGAEAERAIDRDAIIAGTDYAKQYRCQCFVLISTLLAGEPERAPTALRHYAEMKRDSDEHLRLSGLDFLILRPGTLSESPGTGGIGLIDRQADQSGPVAREDVAHLVVAALNAGLRNRVIGFSQGTTNIDEWVRSAAHRHVS